MGVYMLKYSKCIFSIVPLMALMFGFSTAKLQAVDGQMDDVKSEVIDGSPASSDIKDGSTTSDEAIKGEEDQDTQNIDKKDSDTLVKPIDKGVVNEPRTLADNSEASKHNLEVKMTQTNQGSDRSMVQSNQDEDDDEDEDDDPIVEDLDVLSQPGSKTSSFASAVDAVDIDCVFPGDGPFTVFAPSNDAFRQIPADTLKDLLKPENEEKLCKVLALHVVPGKILEGDLAKANLTSVSGKKLDLKVEGEDIFINGAKINKKATVLPNGMVVYEIEKVIMP